MVARFSQLLTCQTVTGTKRLQRSLHFCTLLIHLLAGFGSKECHLVFHVQARLHKKMVEKHFDDISGALLVFDDIIIGGKSEEEHDLILRKVMRRARERNIKFNRDRIQFRVN